MAEQFVGQQLLLQGTTVHRHEGLRRPGAMQVHVAGHEFLAGAGFAGDQDVAIGGRDLASRVQQALETQILGNDVDRALVTLDAPAQVPVFPLQAHHVQGAPDHLTHLVQTVGLGHVVEGAFLHRRHGGIQGGVAGDDDDFHVRLELPGLAQHGQPIHAFHAQVGQHHVELLLAQFLHAGLAALPGHHVVALLAEQMGQILQRGHFIVDDKEAGGVRGGHGFSKVSRFRSADVSLSPSPSPACGGGVRGSAGEGRFRTSSPGGWE